MTTQEKIQKIREECIKVNPEIVKLFFGCVLKRKSVHGEDRGDYQVLDRGSGFHPDKLWVSSRVFGVMSIPNERVGYQEELSVGDIQDNYEIIGRPIRLADVLYMLQQTLFTNQWLKKNDVDDLLYNILLRYDLKNDNLEHQSPETIDFIYNLIKN